MVGLRCEDVICVWIDEAAGQPITAAEQRAIDEHLDGCGACRADASLADAMRLDGPFGAPPFAPEDSTRSAWIDRALERARASTAAPVDRAAGIAPAARSSLRAWIGVGIGLAAAALIALGAVSVVWVYHGDQPVRQARVPVAPEAAAEGVAPPEPAPPVERDTGPAPAEIAGSVTDEHTAPTRKKEKVAPPAKKKGFLNVNTKPWTVVFIDGEKVGVTPLVKLALKPGTHTVRVVGENAGIEKIYKVRVLAGKTTTIVKNLEGAANDEAELFKELEGGAAEPATGAAAGSGGRPGRLSVQTKPWSVVYVDGKKVGTTPLVNHPLEPGTHTVTVVNDDHGISRTYKVKVKPDATTTLVKNLL